jgi:hypothetical protein
MLNVSFYIFCNVFRNYILFLFKSLHQETEMNGPSMVTCDVLSMSSMPTVKQLVNAERDPSVALLALATNSGLGRFRDASQLIKEWTVKEYDMEQVDESVVTTPSYISNLTSELGSNVTFEDHARIYENYLHQFILEFGCQIVGVSCGMKCYAMGSEKNFSVPLRSLDCLRCSPEFRAFLACVPEPFRYVDWFWLFSKLEVVFFAYLFHLYWKVRI